MKRNLKHMPPKEVEKAKTMLATGYTRGDICKELKVSRHILNKYLGAVKKDEATILDEIRSNLEEHDTFGKICDETDDYIDTLLREGIPEVLIANLIGLFYDSAEDKFCEYDDDLKTKRRKQAKAEHSTGELMKYNKVLDAKEATQYLKVLETVKDQFNATQADSNSVKVIFTNFDRDMMLEDLNKEEKVIN